VAVSGAGALVEHTAVMIALDLKRQNDLNHYIQTSFRVITNRNALAFSP
jgi:hypothetical protein